MKPLHRHSYQYRAVLLGAVSTIILIFLLYLLTDWRLYFVWIIAFSITTLAMFGVDKALSKTNQARIPEIVLHIFTILGGFPGQLLGRLIFHHKTNFRRHPAFNIVLIASLLLWLLVGYLLFF